MIELPPFVNKQRFVRDASVSTVQLWREQYQRARPSVLHSTRLFVILNVRPCFIFILLFCVPKDCKYDRPSVRALFLPIVDINKRYRHFIGCGLWKSITTAPAIC